MRQDFFIIILVTLCEYLIILSIIRSTGLGVQAMGAFHRRRAMGKDCHCQTKFTDCLKGARDRTETGCNGNIKRKYLCEDEFVLKDGKILEKKSQLSNCKKTSPVTPSPN